MKLKEGKKLYQEYKIKEEKINYPRKQTESKANKIITNTEFEPTPSIQHFIFTISHNATEIHFDPPA